MTRQGLLDRASLAGFPELSLGDGLTIHDAEHWRLFVAAAPAEALERAARALDARAVHAWVTEIERYMRALRHQIATEHARLDDRVTVDSVRRIERAAASLRGVARTLEGRS